MPCSSENHKNFQFCRFYVCYIELVQRVFYFSVLKGLLSMGEPDHKPKHSNDDTSRRAFSDKLDELKKAVSVLYIPKNMSGRNKFMEKWPVAGNFIFQDELIERDISGFGPKDFDLRVALEQQAEERRLDLKLTLNEIEEKSVVSGSLIFDYVSKIIDKYGAEVSRLIYAENIIERVRPGLLAKVDEARKQKEQEALSTLKQEEETIRAKAQTLGVKVRQTAQKQESRPAPRTDIPDDIRPIDIGPDSPPPPAEPAVANVVPVEQAPLPPQQEAPIQPVAEPAPVVLPEAVPVSAPMSHLAANKPEKGFCKALFNRTASQVTL